MGVNTVPVKLVSKLFLKGYLDLFECLTVFSNVRSFRKTGIKTLLKWVFRSLQVSNYSLGYMQFPNPTYTKLLYKKISLEWLQDISKKF